MSLIDGVKKIGIVGGGSAGYFSALYLKKHFPEIEIELIESSKIPVIGVGEATTPLMLKVLHTILGFPVRDFFQNAKPTLKLGVKFDWGKPGDYYYNNPFGFSNLTNAIYHTKNFNNLSLVSILMDKEKAPFVRTAGGIKSLNLPKSIAYHIDNKYFLSYLKNKLLLSGCKIIDAEIQQVDVKGDGKNVEHIVSTTGEKYVYDLFVDCSGFRSLLVGKALQTPWVDYSKSLKTNRAIIGTRDNNDEILPYTTSTTLKHGWLWNTPMQHENHLGYVFSKDHCSDDEAFNELIGHCKTINNEKVINFKTGRHENSWSGNVLAIGNSFAFIEPLESTGIHMILQQLKQATVALVSAEPESNAVKTYNDATNASWDHLKWFIALHFKYNTKLDTPFWKYCQNEIDVAGIQDYLDYYMANGPLFHDEDHPLFKRFNSDPVFSVFAHDVSMAGCGINQEFFGKVNKNIDSDWLKKFALGNAVAATAIGHRAALKYMEENEATFSADLLMPVYQ